MHVITAGAASPLRAGAAPLSLPPPPSAAAGAQAPLFGQDGGTLKALVFGLINTAVGLPSLIAFAAIVFKVWGLCVVLNMLAGERGTEI